MTTIMDALRNANHNLQHLSILGTLIAKDQIKNAVDLLDKGYSLYWDIDMLLEQYGSIENVPDKSKLVVKTGR